jgi:ectoine hydroxylase-related dioxygenase (phytanoyl-CoA dioxygenase family)
VAIARIRFSKRDAKAPAAATLRKVRRGMERDGAVRFDNLFPATLLRRIGRQVMRRHDSGELLAHGLVRDIAGRRTTVLPFDGEFLKPSFYASSKLLAVAESLLGADFCIGSLEVVVALPGAYPQHQHIDGPLRFDRVIGGRKRPFRGDLSGLPPYAVGLAVPLCAVDEENGPTAIWRGSHKAALRPRPPGRAEVSRRFAEERMTGPLGHSYLFDYRTFHCGTPNRSSEPRPLLMLVFTRSWFRDPNLADVEPGVVITKRRLARVAPRHRRLFMLSHAARRRLWSSGGAV